MIKERILKVIDYKGFTKESFFRKIGMSSANFRGKAKETPINSIAIGNIFTEIPDLSLIWLITGNGEMLIPLNENIIEKDILNDEFEKDNKELNKEVRELNKENKGLNAEIRELNKENRGLNTEIRGLNNEIRDLNSEIILITTGESKRAS